jgi:hypothetical protein
MQELGNRKKLLAVCLFSIPDSVNQWTSGSLNLEVEGVNLQNPELEVRFHFHANQNMMPPPVAFQSGLVSFIVLHVIHFEL